jgi:hypothetical protein
MQRVLSLVLTAWAGSLWTICGIVAPSLFSVLPDRQLAGRTAGYFFSVATWLGLAFSVVALVLLARGAIATVKRVDYTIVIVTAAGPLASELILRPIMDAARAAGDMAKFGMLHGVSALFFGIACVGALALVWRSSGASRS